MIDSTSGYEEGSIIELAPPPMNGLEMMAFNARREAHPYGVRRVLPFARVQTRSEPVGISNYFVWVRPNFPLNLSALKGRPD